MTTTTSTTSTATTPTEVTAWMREILARLDALDTAGKIEAGKEADDLIQAVTGWHAGARLGLASHEELLAEARLAEDNFMSRYGLNGRSSKERLATALARRAVEQMTDLQKAYTAIRAAATVAYSDVSAREDAVTALEGWADERFGNLHASFADAAMVTAFKAVLVRIGKAFLTERENVGEDMALANLLRWAMSRTLSPENGLSYIHQIRVSDLGTHLAENAAHQFIVRSLAHGVLGTERAQHLGIYRECTL